AGSAFGGASIQIGVGVGRIQPDCLVEIRDGVGVALETELRVTTAVVGQRVRRILFQNNRELLDCLGELAVVQEFSRARVHSLGRFDGSGGLWRYGLWRGGRRRRRGGRGRHNGRFGRFLLGG